MTNINTAMAPSNRARRSFSDTSTVGPARMKRLILPLPGGPDVAGTFGGRRVVVGLYVVVVAVTGVLGAVLGAVGPEDLTSVHLFGLLELRPTPLGLAVYGAVTVGVLLGALLALVAAVSRRADGNDG